MRMHALETSRIRKNPQKQTIKKLPGSFGLYSIFFFGVCGGSVSPTEILSPSEFQRDLYLKNLSIGLFVLKREGEQGVRGKRGAI